VNGKLTRSLPFAISNMTDEFFNNEGVWISTHAETEATTELDPPAVLAAQAGGVTPAYNLEDRDDEEEEPVEVTIQQGLDVVGLLLGSVWASQRPMKQYQPNGSHWYQPTKTASNEYPQSWHGYSNR
jgi:hypothetical protein